jgi:hypothetical protein
MTVEGCSSARSGKQSWGRGVRTRSRTDLERQVVVPDLVTALGRREVEAPVLLIHAVSDQLSAMRSSSSSPPGRKAAHLCQVDRRLGRVVEQLGAIDDRNAPRRLLRSEQREQDLDLELARVAAIAVLRDERE